MENVPNIEVFKPVEKERLGNGRVHHSRFARSVTDRSVHLERCDRFSFDRYDQLIAQLDHNISNSTALLLYFHGTVRRQRGEVLDEWVFQRRVFQLRVEGDHDMLAKGKGEGETTISITNDSNAYES